jgi:Amt family ammonium transporter
VAGLVGITPAAGYVSPASAILIGLGAGLICSIAVDLLKSNLGIDDALDVFAVHGVGGIWGSLATGLFADSTVNGIGSDGLFYGDAGQFVKQIVAVAVAVAFAGAATFIILKAIDLTIGLRVPEEEEVLGLDSSQHGELAYQL